MINIGQYIETLINWMMIHFSTFFDALNLGIGSFINGFQHILFGIPFYLTIAAMVLLAWAKAGRGVAVFTLLGLLLIYVWDSGKPLCRHWHWFCHPPAWPLS